MVDTSLFPHPTSPSAFGIALDHHSWRKRELLDGEIVSHSTRAPIELDNEA